ncbi:MAG: Pimeloyl-ACP methyl ester carboxylesterase [Chloroflexi bacterium]|jgi:3-oxoadipate enol-lactonase|nr:MAG: Pimeloyl-ACP methyl ester carboxylesterase [Chloroflexota bacterium]
MAIAKVNDVNLHYELRGDGTEPVVLIHGAQGDSRLLEPFVPWLSSRCRMLLFDQRGLGRSDKPDVPYSMALIADDTAQLMSEVGWTSAHIIGVSMGGMIAQELALNHPERVRSLVLGCTAAGGRGDVDSNPAYAKGDLSLGDRARLFAEAIFTPGHLERHPETIQALADLRRTAPLDPAGFARRLEALRAHDTFDRLSQILCPTLVITGADDTLIPADNSRQLASDIPNAELVVLADAAHAFWAEQPEHAFGHILGFLARQSS